MEVLNRVVPHQERILSHNKKACENIVLTSFLLRAPPGTRTLDTLIKSQVLYQLS